MLAAGPRPPSSAPGARHIPKPMAGSPLKRQRKLSVRGDNGSVIAFPYMPRVDDLPPEKTAAAPSSSCFLQA